MINDDRNDESVECLHFLSMETDLLSLEGEVDENQII